MPNNKSRCNQLKFGHPPEKDQMFLKSIHSQFSQTLALLISLSTEVELYFGFGLRERLNYVWGLANSVFAIAKELHDERYGSLLATQ